jgi:hypothetical protein
MHNHEPPIFELSGPGKIGVNLPQIDVPQSELPVICCAPTILPVCRS